MLLRVILCSLALSPTLLAQGPKQAVDNALRFLRYSQSESGAFGESVETTARVLYAFASSPRSYRADDGPWLSRGIQFITQTRAADGSYGTSGEDRGRATLSALVGLKSLGADIGSAHYESAAAYVSKTYGEVLAPTANQKTVEAYARKHLGANFPPEEPKAAAAGGLLQPLLGSQAREGYYGERDIALTANQTMLVSACMRALKKNAGEAPPYVRPKTRPLVEANIPKMRERGAAFLMQPSQKVDGMWGFGSFPDLGITAMVIGAFQTVPEDARSDEIRQEIERGLDLLVAAQHEDGSIHRGQVVAYTTSVAILALAQSDKESHRAAVQKARKFLETLQADEGEGYDESHKYYGGIGYGNDERPDLSNLQIAMDALREAGVKEESEVYGKALRFLERCQNRSESNPIDIKTQAGRFVAGNDGGGTYMPANSPAGAIELSDGRKVARSYGSMSYALLKGFLFAGLPKEDPRVAAVFEWVSRNYTVDENPGFQNAADPREAKQGYFYYLYTMGRTLDVYGTGEIVDGKGRKHDWRAEISGRLASLQREDGSWINEDSERWWEGNPVLATAYALLTLPHCEGN